MARDLDGTAVLDRSRAGQGGFMEYKSAERTQQIKPAAPPINLDSGKLDVIQAGMAGGYVLVAMLVVSLGAGMVIYIESTFVRGLGAGIAIIGIAFGGTVLYVSLTTWLDHRRRVEQWHQATIETWIDMSGSERLEYVNEWELSSSNIAHVIVAALWVLDRIREGETNAHTVRKMTGPLFLCGRRIGNLTKDNAAAMGQQFARLGLIQDRREGFSGTWVADTADQVFYTILERWKQT